MTTIENPINELAAIHEELTQLRGTWSARQRKRRAQAIHCFAAGYNAEAIAKAASVSLGTLLAWVTGADGTPLVENESWEALAKEVETRSIRTSSQRERLRALRGAEPQNRRHAEYRRLVDSRAEMVREYQRAHGERYQTGADEKLDALTMLIEHYFD